MDEVRLGQTVFYRIAPDVVRPATVVHIWNPTCVQLQVFVDGPNDVGLSTGPNTAEAANGLMWRTSVVSGDGIGQFSTKQPQLEVGTGVALDAKEDAPPADDQDGSELVKEPKSETTDAADTPESVGEPAEGGLKGGEPAGI